MLKIPEFLATIQPMDHVTPITAAQADTVTTLFNLGAHLGHKKNRLHPQARKYLHSIINGISVIDLSKTVQQLDAACSYITQLSSEGKHVLFVATKKASAPSIAKMCRENAIPAVTMKWISGLLTNFDSIMKNVKHMNDMKDAQTKGDWDAFVKHERIKLQKDLLRLEKWYGGLDQLHKRPDVLVVVDIRREKNAVKEAQQMHIPVVALVDTNANPDTIEYPIVSNDDSPEVIAYYMQEFVSAILAGRKEAESKK